MTPNSQCIHFVLRGSLNKQTNNFVCLFNDPPPIIKSKHQLLGVNKQTNGSSSSRSGCPLTLPQFGIRPNHANSIEWGLLGMVLDCWHECSLVLHLGSLRIRLFVSLKFVLYIAYGEFKCKKEQFYFSCFLCLKKEQFVVFSS